MTTVAVRKITDPLTALAESGALTPTSLNLDAATPFKQYEALGAWLGKLRDAGAWWIGDWILFGEGVYGEKYAQAVESTGRSKNTLEQYARVAQAIPPKRRRRELTFHHHRLVAPRRYTPEEQTEWLAQAIAHNWSVEEMEGAMRAIPSNGDVSSPDASGLDQHVNKGRLQEVAMSIARRANPLGDGRYAVDGELIAQLRAAAGIDE